MQPAIAALFFCSDLRQFLSTQIYLSEHVMNSYLLYLTLTLTLVLTGCANYAPSSDLVGASRDVLTTRMGQPEREVSKQGYKELHFPRGPAGSHTYFVRIDENDRVLGWDQVLTESQFSRITPGMTEQQVIDTIGITKIVHGLALSRGYVWHYRFETTQCKSFVIEFTPENLVRDAGYRIRSGRRCKQVGM
ncbi:MAG: hypothetical protein LW805_07155 [Oxalobacteraceae bacterium]|nr:hypothetical protein [Oxalobacteraceae bacterium]